jgi:hypothetical protein
VGGTGGMNGGEEDCFEFFKNIVLMVVRHGILSNRNSKPFW